MSESDDAASRGRAIFQRLRADKPVNPPTPVGSTPSQPAGTASAEPGSAGPPRAPLPGTDDLKTLDLGEAGGDAEQPDGASAARLEAVVQQAAEEAQVEAEAAEVEPDPVVGTPAQPTDTSTAHDEPSTLPSQPLAATTSGPAPDAPVEAPVAEPNHFARALPRVMAVANQKGGVGKTTTAVNLGACLADIGYRVLVVDLDPQGNASTGLGINIRDLQGSMYDVILHDLPIEDCVEATSVRNLFCAPSSLDLAGAEIELVPAFSRELRLKRALDDVRDDYDFVLIDCPPSLGLLTVNGLAAATEVVVPIQCEYYALEGLGQLLRNVNLVQRNLNPGLEVSAIVLVMYDARTKLADQVVSEVRDHFGAKVCRNVVPRTVRLSEAPSFGQPIIAFDASSRGAIAYRELAKEVSGGTPQRTR